MEQTEHNTEIGDALADELLAGRDEHGGRLEDDGQHDRRRDFRAIRRSSAIFKKGSRPEYVSIIPSTY